jgi:glycogen debranching enzyme
MPTSCSPQAWSSAAPLLLLRHLVGLEPDADGGLTVNPMPGGDSDIVLRGISCGDGVYDVRAGDNVEVVRVS